MKGIEWIFLNTQRNDSILKEVALDNQLTVTTRSVNSWEDLRNILKGIKIFDVSGLPKEDLAQVLGLVLGRKGIRLYTLTRDDKNPYIDLMAQPTVQAFANGYLVQTLIVKTAAVLVFAGLNQAA